MAEGAHGSGHGAIYQAASDESHHPNCLLYYFSIATQLYQTCLPKGLETLPGEVSPTCGIFLFYRGEHQQRLRKV